MDDTLKYWTSPEWEKINCFDIIWSWSNISHKYHFGLCFWNKKFLALNFTWKSKWQLVEKNVEKNPKITSSHYRRTKTHIFHIYNERETKKNVKWNESHIIDTDTHTIARIRIKLLFINLCLKCWSHLIFHCICHSVRIDEKKKNWLYDRCRVSMRLQKTCDKTHDF